jgi:hypothetical protein
MPKLTSTHPSLREGLLRREVQIRIGLLFTLFVELLSFAFMASGAFQSRTALWVYSGTTVSVGLVVIMAVLWAHRGSTNGRIHR